MKILELEQPIIGDIIEFETDPDTVVEGKIVAETEDGYIYEFSNAGLVALTEAHGNSKVYDKCWTGYKKVPGKKRGEKGSCEKVEEAEYQGRDVELGKPMAGDVKKSKVYVRNEKGTVVKVNFGDPNMRIKKSNPARRKSFRARHNCENPGPRWKARYWSCRAW